MANKGSHNFSFVFFDIRNLKTVSQIQLSLTENVLLFENYKFQKLVVFCILLKEKSYLKLSR